jgi:glutamate synthase domain-containing protein 2/glutamate synthase domain-containing protein 1/glutamate synthase domain-containing protein 3
VLDQGACRSEGIRTDPEHHRVPAPQDPAGVGEDVGATLEHERHDPEPVDDLLDGPAVVVDPLGHATPPARGVAPRPQPRDHVGAHPVRQDQARGGAAPRPSRLDVVGVRGGDRGEDRVVLESARELLVEVADLLVGDRAHAVEGRDRAADGAIGDRAVGGGHVQQCSALVDDDQAVAGGEGLGQRRVDADDPVAAHEDRHACGQSVQGFEISHAAYCREPERSARLPIRATALPHHAGRRSSFGPGPPGPRAASPVAPGEPVRTPPAGAGRRGSSGRDEETAVTETNARHLPGLHDPRFEHDECGIGFVAQVDGAPRREIVTLALEGLRGVEHRGAVAADATSGDGAGLLTQIPREFVVALAAEHGATDVAPADLGLALLFLAAGDDAAAQSARATAYEAVAAAAVTEGIRIVGWRDVPTDLAAIGDEARAGMPHLAQAILVRPVGADDRAAERAAYRMRRRALQVCREAGVRFYAASCSFLTVTYKAMAAAGQVDRFYLDLQDDRFTSAFAIFHSRFSTNTMPTWERAQPFRLLCHNGEINTIEGNAKLMQAREGQMVPGVLSADGDDWIDPALLFPVIDADQSDSAKLDAALDVLVRGGRDVRHAQAMLVPQVWEGVRDIDSGVRDFYRYHACLVEPWDGPAGLIFTDGRRVGATLDRNGLRPLRYLVCEDGIVIAASEVGAIRTAGRGVVRRERLGPGQMLCVDPDEGGLQENTEIKAWLAERQPYGAWVDDNITRAAPGRPVGTVPADLHQRQLAYGLTKEEVISILRPMATQGKEATSSMGDDTPIEPLAHARRPVAHYLKQRFAQVTNPPIDHYREHEVMSLRTLLGPRAPILTERPEAARLVELPSFFLYPDGLQQLLLDPAIPFPVQAVDATFPSTEGIAGLAAALQRIGDEAIGHVEAGAGILVVSDVGADHLRCRVPILLAVGAVHQRLLAAGRRTSVSLVAETDEARETHDVAALLGYGADAIVPRLVLQTITDLADAGRIGSDNPSASEAQERYRRAVEDGVLKIMSKMGISTLDSYRSAQIFEAVGLGPDVVDTCFTGTVSRLGGLTLEDLARDVLTLHETAFPDQLVDPTDLPDLPSPGIIRYRQGGEFHDMNKPVVDALHDALGLGRRAATPPLTIEDVRLGETAAERAAGVLETVVDQGRMELYERFAELVNGRPVAFPRDLLESVGAVAPLPLEEVEPVHAITARFSTGAMSHGALSAEAHETLAAGMNLVGARANSGEGGEAPERHRTRGELIDRDCRIKQIASGRFGVTPQYLAFAEELQIKMAQGSKPGEGGQIPGHKVTEEIAQQRHTSPGVTLISPPPHHDIYSIEDLAQLVFDLKQVNPEALISVKLVAEAGVGTIAAGVVKALADVVHVSGADGGTGASPLSSVQHAGLPWELGLAEIQQTLRQNHLRGRVRIRVDGGFKTGKDVFLAALLGADEYSFGTAALFAEGCIMARACHRDTCPVGVATQRRDLRDKFEGNAAMVAAYMVMVAEEVRGWLARSGLRSLDEAIGRVDLLRPRPVDGLAERLDVAPLLHDPGTGERRFTGRTAIQDPRSDLGDRVFEDALETVFLGGIVEYTYDIRNRDRTVGARLGGAVGLEFGAGTPNGLARLRFSGEAGQSFGAFLANGVELVLDGEANDYVGKGMGGGTIVVRPPEDDAGDPVLVGNTVLYGATGGELFVAGRAGERFAVRNSGAVAVVEGVGQHACEYMTGGTVVILGPTGSNVGAGMSGGECYVFDPTSEVLARVNRQLVEAHRPTVAQIADLQRLVERHGILTGSRRAAEMLANWEEASGQFWRVAPKSELDRLATAETSTSAD